MRSVHWPTALDILDVDTGEPCPPGVIGGVGEHRRARASSAATTRTPTPRRSGWRGGVYHSGDLAYRDETGYVYFAGRLGDWMRVDGENLGTAPIERILMRYPDVTEAAVYAIPDPDSR